MRVFKMLAVLAVLGLAGPASAAVYKCVGPDGKTTWSDRPCTVYPDTKSAAPEAEAPVEVAPAPEVAPAAGPAAVSAPAASEPATPSEPQEPELSREQQAQMEQEEMEAQMAAMQADFVKQLRSKAWIFALSFVLMVVAWLMHVIAAVRMDKIAWAVCLFLFSPFSNILFTVLHWQKAKLGFFIYMAGLAMMIAAVVSLYSAFMPLQGP